VQRLAKMQALHLGKTSISTQGCFSEIERGSVSRRITMESSELTLGSKQLEGQDCLSSTTFAFRYPCYGTDRH
jgi:hypothetical protein